MQLQEIGADPLDHLIDQGIVGIDQHRDRAEPALGDGGKHARRLDLDMARAPREHDQPDKVGAGLGRGFNHGRGAHAANLNLYRHVSGSRVRGFCPHFRT